MILLISALYAANACPYLKTRKLQGMGMGMGMGGDGNGGAHGMGGGNGGMGPGMLIQRLFDNHEQIDRKIEYNNDGTIRTTTTSSDSTVVSDLQDHVEQMQDLIQEDWQIRAWDPFFVELFDQHQEFSMDPTNLDNGVEVHLSAETDCGQALIESHTAVVTLFVNTGREEGMKSHDVPAACLIVVGDTTEEVDGDNNQPEVDTDKESDLDTMKEDEVPMEYKESLTTTNNITSGNNNTLLEDEGVALAEKNGTSSKATIAEYEISSASFSLTCLLPVSFLLVSFLVTCCTM